MASLESAPVKSGHLGHASLVGSVPEGLLLFQETLERIAEACVVTFEKVAGADMAVTCSLASLSQEIAGDAIAAADVTTTTAVFEVPAQASRLLVQLEDPLLQLVIEMMCGGICSEPVPTTGRPGTSIDRQFARVAFNALSATFEKECASFGLGAIGFSQIQSKLDPKILGKRSAKVTVATFGVECLGREGNFNVIFPQTILDRFKQDMLPRSEPIHHVDPEWSGRLKAEISRTFVTLDAFLDADQLTLGRIATLKVGDILTLPKTASSRCELRSDGKPLFRCELGQADGHYSLRIEEAVARSDASSSVSPTALSIPS